MWASYFDTLNVVKQVNDVYGFVQQIHKSIVLKGDFVPIITRYGLIIFLYKLQIEE